jgi:hypothetical protein
MKSTIALLLLSSLPLLSGCSDPLNQSFTTPQMMDKGIIYVLPGIQGVDLHYLNIRSGLQGSGIKCAIKIHPWGCHIPGIGLAINETDTTDDRGWGQKIAQEIQAYQKQYPGRPVYLIGQSGGCGVSVFAAEALAQAGAPPVDGLVLLDASLSATYDLATALGQSHKGLVNFYNLDDVRLLEVGTAMFGNVDGGHGDSAGRTGFEVKFPKLYQVQVTQGMVSAFANPHFADTSAAFASRYLAPWIIDRTWPVQCANPQ